jgi:hypothetical protein
MLMARRPECASTSGRTVELAGHVGMNRPIEWRKVLDAEVRRWSAMSRQELVSRLDDVQCYEVEFDSKTYQVEVQLLENTEEYLHVMVGVDDGSLPASIAPWTETFRRAKQA